MKYPILPGPVIAVVTIWAIGSAKPAWQQGPALMVSTLRATDCAMKFQPILKTINASLKPGATQPYCWKNLPRPRP